MSLLVSWNLGVLSYSAACRGQVACDLQRVGIGEICFSVSLRSIICHEPVVFTTAKCFHGPWSPVDVSGGPWFRRHNPGGPQGPQFCSRRYNTGTLGAGKWLATRHCLEVCPSYTLLGGALVGLFRAGGVGSFSTLVPSWLAPYKESNAKPRQHIKKPRYHFANKGPYSQGYGFSGSHAQV